MVAVTEQWQITGRGPQAYERYAVGQLFRPLGERLLAAMPLQPGDRVLDVACGTGIVARLAAPRVGPGGNVAGLDLNDAMLSVARARSKEEGVAITWKQGDAAALPFAEDQFNVVVCQQGLQFVPDKARALAEMRRVAVPGGLVALAVFGTVNRFDGALAAALARHVSEEAAELSLARFALGDRAALVSLVEQAELAPIEVRTEVLMRRVQPTQTWLLEATAGVPYGADVAAMQPGARAAMVREIAAELKGLWSIDCFVVPMDIHFVYARKGGF